MACVLVLAACRAPRLGAPSPVAAAGALGSSGVEVAALGEGAAPGNEDGPGGFVPRGTARNFYAAAGGRLWYYLNNYYWAPASAPRADLWIKAEVVEEFRDLTRWPDGAAVRGPDPKVTVEYWKVGSTGRSVRLDNHKDYCLLSDQYTAGAIEVRATLELGHVLVADKKGRFAKPGEAYVLERRNYNDDRGIGAERTRFEPLRGYPVTVWGYRVPWSTHPARLTRSDWQDLEAPEWRLLETRQGARRTAPVLTAPDDAGPLDPELPE